VGIRSDFAITKNTEAYTIVNSAAMNYA